MGAYTMVTVLYFKIDAVMLSSMVGNLETGHYGNAYDFVEGSLFISAAAGSVLYPRLLTAADSRRGLIFDTLFKFILIAAAAVACGFIVFGAQVGLFFAGNEFEGAVRPLHLLAFGLPFMFGNGLLSRWLFSHGQEKLALKSAALMAVFNIIGNWYLIPGYGASGAATMTVLTEGLLFLIWILVGRKARHLLFLWIMLLAAIGLAWWAVSLGHIWLTFLGSLLTLGPGLVFYGLKVRQLG